MDPVSATPILSDLISTLYGMYLQLYGDEEVASVLTANAVNNILAEQAFARHEVN